MRAMRLDRVPDRDGRIIVESESVIRLLRLLAARPILAFNRDTGHFAPP